MQLSGRHLRRPRHRHRARHGPDLILRRIAGLATVTLLVPLVFFMVGGAATAEGRDQAPPEGCKDVEVGTSAPVELPDGITVSFVWTPKDDAEGQYIGFSWRATGGLVYGTAKDGGTHGGVQGGKEYSWGPAASGALAVDEDDNGRMHGISYVIVCGEPEAKGSITVKKRAPEQYDFDFQLRFGDRTDVRRVGGGGETTWSHLPDGTFQLTELVPLGWTLEGVSCDSPIRRVGDGVEIVLPIEPAARCVDCEKVRDVTCVFYDVKDEPPEYGSITVGKLTAPTTESEFEFEIALGDRTHTFSLSGMNSRETSVRTFEKLPPGTYVISELLDDLAPGYEFVDVSCSGGPYRHAGAMVGIPLDSGDQYVCVFENEKPTGGSITVVKSAPDDRSQSFEIHLAPSPVKTVAEAAVLEAALLKDGLSQTWSGLEGGTYFLGERVPTRWELERITCGGPGGRIQLPLDTRDGLRGGEVAVGAGEHISCLIENDRESSPSPPTESGEIRIVKRSPGTERFAFQASWTSVGFTIANNEVHSSGQLPPGTYQVNETMSAAQADAGWRFGRATCTDGSPINAIQLGAGEVVTCTFENAQVLAEVVVATTTTTVAVAPVAVGTLPFTGTTAVGTGMVALFVLALGGLVVLAATPVRQSGR